MSNEQRMEELYHKAYEKGFIDDFRQEVTNLKTKHSKTSLYEIVELAYKNCKKNAS